MSDNLKVTQEFCARCRLGMDQKRFKCGRDAGCRVVTVDFVKRRIGKDKKFTAEDIGMILEGLEAGIGVALWNAKMNRLYLLDREFFLKGAYDNEVPAGQPKVITTKRELEQARKFSEECIQKEMEKELLRLLEEDDAVAG